MVELEPNAPGIVDAVANEAEDLALRSVERAFRGSSPVNLDMAKRLTSTYATSILDKVDALVLGLAACQLPAQKHLQ